MPPSPVRFSPGRELKVDNQRRGHSLERGMHFREDDDLALFNEVENKEHDNFLLQSDDDIDDLFATRLKYFSDCKLTVAVPVGGENSEFLNADDDKNDYDWLITPPDTPLFPSLDDEASQVSLVSRGRPRSHPISISRSSTMEKSYQSSKGSASSNRLSPSPRAAYQSRGRLSSASHSSPPLTFLNATPSRGSSPSPNKHGAPSLSPAPTYHNTTPLRKSSPLPDKPSISVSRSVSPTPRRSTDSSTTVSSSRTRGASSVKTSKGNSLSPKIKAWPNIPGFSSEVPPNIRTSLADHPASNMRRSSPASRNSLKSGRHSTFPSGSRSVSSSPSQKKDQFSSLRRGLVASSGNDDVDSILSLSMGTSSDPKSIPSSLNGKALAYSKRPNRMISQNSAPKRSSDMAVRRLKAPHKMFRPLLSSAPTSTFYSGKSAAAHQSIESRNSSITTSSYTSTDLGTSGAHDTEDSEHNLEEVTSMYTATPLSDIQDPLFAFNDGDAEDDDGGKKMHVVSSSSQYAKREGHVSIDFESVDNESFIQHDTSAAGVMVREVDLAGAENLEDSVICSKCSLRFGADNLKEGDLMLCPNCRSSELIPVTSIPLTTKTAGNFPLGISSKILEYECPDTYGMSFLHESSETRDSEKAYHDVVINNDQHFQSEESRNMLSEDLHAEELNEKRIGDHPETAKSYVSNEISGCGMSFQQDPGLQLNDSESEVPEPAGISLLFRRSSSCIGHIVQNRSCASSEFPSYDLAYVRGTAYSLNSSIGHVSMPTSSSADLSSMNHVETRIQRQHIGKKPELENYRYDTHSKHQRSTSYISGASTHTLKFLTSSTNSCEEGSDLSVVHVEKNLVQEKLVRPQDCTEVSATHFVEDIVEEECAEPQEQLWTDAGREGVFTGLPETAREHFSNNRVSHLENTSVTPVSNCEEFSSHVNGENSTILSNKDEDTEVPFSHCETCDAVDSSTSDLCVFSVDGVQVQNGSGLDKPSKVGAENDVLDSSGPESVVNSPNLRSKEDEIQEHPNTETLYIVSSFSVEESDSVGHAPGIIEDTTVIVESRGGMKARSLTLDEATDTILFCSSIVQNLAYEAASTAIEKENTVLECSRPAMAIVGKTNTDRRITHNKTESKHTPKLKKAKKPVEREQTLPSKTESEEIMEDESTTKIVGAPNKVDSLKPPNLESKCNCRIM